MSNSTRETFKNPVINWIDERLPIFTMLQKEYGSFPTPRNFNYLWNFGALSMFMLITMIVTGIFLAMEYTPSTDHAFNSVERIMRDVNWGWFMRYMHANGASFFFIVVYVHIFRGMYYGSYKKPRELLWIMGVIILLLMMATAFMGYVLPWGQMSFWGATVITNLFSAIPWIGNDIVTWLIGGFSVDNPTLNRFFALHYLLPFIIVAVVVLHVAALHVSGSNNPLGIEPKTAKDTIPFHPYYTTKDMFGLTVFMIFYAAVVFYFPNALGDPDNYIQANPMQTPAHIVPEWYLLPFYAILRSFVWDINLAFLTAMGLFGGIVCGLYTTYKASWAKSGPMFFGMSLLAIVAGLIGTGIYYVSLVWLIPATQHIIPISSKLGGVILMVGAIILILLMPWLDRSPVRSAVFRPLYRIIFWFFVLTCVTLGYIGAQPPEEPFVTVGQVATALYFLFFLIALPLLTKFEKTKPLPSSIADAVLKSGADHA
jgi:ubiquinol-cytochrome c reductase cytochrome b subunit